MSALLGPLSLRRHRSEMRRSPGGLFQQSNIVALRWRPSVSGFISWSSCVELRNAHGGGCHGRAFHTGL
jgi:hypothetical protein